MFQHECPRNINTLNLNQLIHLLHELERFGDPCNVKPTVKMQIKHLSITENTPHTEDDDMWDYRRKILENINNPY